MATELEAVTLAIRRLDVARILTEKEAEALANVMIVAHREWMLDNLDAREVS